MGIFILASMYADRYAFEVFTLDKCTVRWPVHRSDQTLFQCEERPEVTINFRRREAPSTWDLLPMVAKSKTPVSIRYRRAFGINDLEEMVFEGQAYEGMAAKPDPIFLTITFMLFGLINMAGGVWLFFFKYFHPSGDFERGYIERP